MRVGKIIAIFGSFGILCFMSSWSLFQTSSQEPPPSSSQQKKNALEAYKMHNALEFLNQHAPNIDLTTDIGQKRLESLIDQYSESDSQHELVLLYEAFPSAFDYKEQASLVIANAFLITKQTDRYYALRQNWKGHEREPEQWFFMDAWALTLNEHFMEAADLLSSRSLKGDAETTRLTRLALLHIVDNPKLSWKYLSEAAFKDPENPLLNTYKAYLLESANKPLLAQTEYIYAVQKEPENPLLREQLADFYFRVHQYDQALKIIQDSLDAPSSETIWLKALFLSRVIAPIKYNWDSNPVPEGTLSELIYNLKELPPGIFWNHATFDRLPQAEYYLTNQQETFWLKLLMALKNNKENEALEILQQNPFQTVSWMPELECQLKSVLTYRRALQQGSLNNDPADTPKEYLADPKNIDMQTCLDILTMISKVPSNHISSADIPRNLYNLIQSKEIFASLFVAAGWDEAALQLHTLAVIPSEFPDWIALQLTEAINRNRGAAQALQFARNQKATPQLTLLSAQLAIASKQLGISIELLKDIYKNGDEIGRNAAKLLSSIYLEQGNTNGAKEAILAQPILASELSSREILAKIALQSGDTIAANSLYLSLENESSEAKAFLARKAFADKDWKRAKMLTEALIKLYPNNFVLKENLHQILLAEQKDNLKMR